MSSHEVTRNTRIRGELFVPGILFFYDLLLIAQMSRNKYSDLIINCFVPRLQSERRHLAAWTLPKSLSPMMW